MVKDQSFGAVVYREDQAARARLFLLLLYPEPNRQPPEPYWDLAKGHALKGETPEATVRREVQEETGIRDLVFVPDFKTQTTFNFVAGGLEYQKTVDFYLAQTSTLALRVSHEHLEAGWFNAKTALAKVKFEGARRVLCEAIEFLAAIDYKHQDHKRQINPN